MISVEHKHQWCQEGLQDRGAIMKTIQDSDNGRYIVFRKEVTVQKWWKGTRCPQDIEARWRESAVWPWPVPREVPDGQGWGCPWCAPAALLLPVVVGWALVGRSWWDTMGTLHPLGSSRPSRHPDMCFQQQMLEQQWCWQPNGQGFGEKKGSDTLVRGQHSDKDIPNWFGNYTTRKTKRHELERLSKTARTVQNVEKQLLKKSWETVSVGHLIMSFLPHQHWANASVCYSEKMSPLSVAWHKSFQSLAHIFWSSN